MEYKDLNSTHYNDEILPKAKAYLQTKKVQSLRADIDYERMNISKGETMSLERLMSIILYTDYSELSSSFTSTFRKRHAFEPLQTTKRRHRNYYWMSKLLYETVVHYGASHNNAFAGGDKILGPFFCGMSMIMHMPQFNIELSSPTSTSVHIEVAMKFSANGIIIQFSNDSGKSTNTLGLDVSWLSRFHEEDERYTHLLCFQTLTITLFIVSYLDSSSNHMLH